MDYIQRLIESSGGPSVFVAIWVWAVLAFVLAFILFYLFMKRKANLRFKRRLNELTPLINSLIEDLRNGHDCDSKISELISTSDYPELISYLENRLSGTKRTDTSAELQIAKQSGLVDYLKKRVTSRDEWKRALALRALSCLEDKDNIPLFREAVMKDKFNHAVYAAAIGLALTSDVDSLENVLSRVYVDDPPNRDTILTILAGYGKDGCEAATRALEKGDLPPAVQGALADYLGNLRYKEARPVIEKRLSASDDTGANIHFIEALEKVGSADTCALIEPYLESDDFRLRLKTINALERMGGTKYLSKAEEETMDPSPWVARNAAEALSRMGNKGTKRLTELTRSKHDGQRQAAKLVLAELEYKRMRWRFRYADSLP